MGIRVLFAAFSSGRILPESDRPRLPAFRGADLNGMKRVCSPSFPLSKDAPMALPSGDFGFSIGRDLE